MSKLITFSNSAKEVLVFLPQLMGVAGFVRVLGTKQTKYIRTGFRCPCWGVKGKSIPPGNKLSP